jgi:hypothetical protein
MPRRPPKRIDAAGFPESVLASTHALAETAPIADCAGLLRFSRVSGWSCTWAVAAAGEIRSPASLPGFWLMSSAVISVRSPRLAIMA